MSAATTHECCYPECGGVAEWVGDSTREPGARYRCPVCHRVSMVLADDTEEEEVCRSCGSPAEAPDPTCGACPPTERVPCQIDGSCTFIGTEWRDLDAHQGAAHPETWECLRCCTTTAERTRCHECGGARPVEAHVLLHVSYDPEESREPEAWDWGSLVGEEVAVAASWEVLGTAPGEACAGADDVPDMVELRERVQAWRAHLAQVRACEEEGIEIPDDARTDADTESARLLDALAARLWPDLARTVPACEYLSARHHSADRIEVHHGAQEGPATLCGYHASPEHVAGALAFVHELRETAPARVTYAERLALLLAGGEVPRT